MKTIVILTGAGLSAESGLATFRDNNGLWCNHRVEDVATPEAYERNPKLVQDFYNMRRAQLKEAKPNAAHLALAELAARFDGRVFLITQNVDDLHEKAVISGQWSVDKKEMPTTDHRSLITLYHMHGELRKARCEYCDAIHHWEDDLDVDTPCPSCSIPDPGLRRGKGRLRPHIVWFGEMPLQMELIGQALAECDLFISIGTSGNVYPAAGLVREARMNGKAHTVELNMEPSQGHSLFHERIYGPATKIVPEYVDVILARHSRSGDLYPFA